MKKILFILSILIIVALIGFGIFYFFAGGKQTVNNFFQDNTFGNFFDIDPQSQNDFTSNPIINPTTPTNTGPYVPPTLRQISFEPVSGYTFFSTTSTSTRSSLDEEGNELIEEFLATSTVVRFQERATGHIYDVFEFLQAPQQVSAITEQKTYKTLWSNNKDTFVFQNLISNNEAIQTTLGRLSFSTSTETILNKTILSGTISDFVLNKDTNKLIYSIKEGGISTIYTSNIDRTNEAASKTLYFNDFVLDVVNQNDVLITTKASRTTPGYAYILNTSTNNFTKILGNIAGLLVKVNPTKEFALYAESDTDHPSARLVNLIDNTVSLLTFDTLPSEKCVFSKKEVSAYCFGSLIYQRAEYPDDWYKGKILNYENLYKISLEDASISVIYNFPAEDFDLDAIDVQLTDNDEKIIFQNKYDLTLWMLNLNNLSNEIN